MVKDIEFFINVKGGKGLSKRRIESFTDAVSAIIITILVLGLKSPESGQAIALWHMKEQFVVYVLSFFLLAIYWLIHHKLLSKANSVNERVLWANLVMLFWMSLIPFATSWVGAYINSIAPAILYGTILLLTNISYAWLIHELIKENGKDSKIYCLYYKNKKMMIAIILSIVINGFVFIVPIFVLIGCLAITIIWFIPNKNAENYIKK